MPTFQIMTNTDWLTLALVVITAFYAWATLKILRANEAMVSTMRDQQNAAMRPYILVSTSVRTGTQLLYLSIKNVGKTAALGLKLSLDKISINLVRSVRSEILPTALHFHESSTACRPMGNYFSCWATALRFIVVRILKNSRHYYFKSLPITWQAPS